MCFGLLSFVAPVAFLAFISIRFDFGDSFYPSRAEPYLWSGRYISGALIPFVILYVYGLERALRWTHKKWPPIATVAIIAIAITLSEIQVSRSVFSAPIIGFISHKQERAIDRLRQRPTGKKQGPEVNNECGDHLFSPFAAGHLQLAWMR
jgi:hypothetical protein